MQTVRISSIAKRGADFGFERTLSGRSYLHLIRQLKNKGYAAHFFFLWVPSVDLALSRVRARVSEGGHNVPEVVVRRRFGRSIRNFFSYYRRLADSWSLFDNSGATPVVIAFEKQGEAHIMEREIYNELVARYGET